MLGVGIPRISLFSEIRSSESFWPLAKLWHAKLQTCRILTNFSLVDTSTGLPISKPIFCQAASCFQGSYLSSQGDNNTPTSHPHMALDTRTKLKSSPSSNEMQDCGKIRLNQGWELKSLMDYLDKYLFKMKSLKDETSSLKSKVIESLIKDFLTAHLPQ